jgi:MYXO-CTERM domain-containing protein
MPAAESPQSIVEPVLTTAQINGSGLPAKTVVLTYDDGPDDHTLELAHYLADQGVRATFFVNGKRFCKTFDGEGKCTAPQDTRPCTNGQMQAAVTSPKYYPEAWLDEVQSLGHRIANHTQDHCHMPGESMADAIWEVKTTQDILDRHICDNVYLMRAPFGEWNATVVSRVNSMMGLNKIVGPINWDVDGNDWDCWQKKKTPQACLDGYMAILNGRASKNGIFLMHDRPEFNVTYEGPLLMAKLLVPRLKAEGFKFATMDDVLKLPPRTMNCPLSPAPDAGTTPPDAGIAGDATTAPSDAHAELDTGATATGGSAPTPTGGTTGSPGTGGAKGSTGGAPGTGGDDGTGGDAPPPGSASGSKGGCNVAKTPASAFAPLLVALAALARRRRRR